MREYEVMSLEEYVKVIKEVRGEGFSFFRGQESIIKQPLLPSLLRQDGETKNRIYSNICDGNFLNIFKAKRFHI